MPEMNHYDIEESQMGMNYQFTPEMYCSASYYRDDDSEYDSDESCSLMIDHYKKQSEKKKNDKKDEDNKKEEPKFTQTENGKTIKLLFDNFECFKQLSVNYPDWFPVVCAINNSVENKKECYDLIHYFSKLCIDKYDRDDVDKEVKKIFEREDYNNKKKTIASLIYYAKKENGEKYKQLFSKKNKEEERVKIEMKKLKLEKQKSKLERIQNEEEMMKTNEEKFDEMVIEFEKNHLLITDISSFIKHTDEGYIIMTERQLITSYKHKSYGYDKDGNKLNFISKWLNNNDDIRKKTNIGIYPNPEKCPKDIFNIWTPFAMALVKDYEHKQKELDILLHHIKILCGHDEPTYNHFILWIAQMLQYPEVKTICPYLVSLKGAGKGTLMSLLCALIGKKKYKETPNPSRDVWGNFNEDMGSCFLVNLDELSKKEMLAGEDKMKTLITNPILTINGKNKTPYDITSYHRFIVTTNGQDWSPDRRCWVIRSSDEKIQDKQYFEDLRMMIADVNVVKTCYEYFMQIKDADKFCKLPVPTTEFQNDLIEANKSIVEQFMYYFVLQHSDEKIVEKLGCEMFTMFCRWKDKNKIVYELNSIKLSLKIKQLKLNGITKGKHTKEGNTILYDIDVLKKHFGIGCLVELKEKDDEGN